jgi:hypothetical protein
MLEEWGEAIRASIEERNTLRRDLDLARRSLVKALDEKQHTERQMRDVLRKLATAQQEKLGLIERIRYLEAIAHQTGHIIQCGGTK